METLTVMFIHPSVVFCSNVGLLWVQLKAIGCVGPRPYILDLL